MALVTGEPRSATVRSLGATRVLQTLAFQLAYVGVEGRLYSIAQGRLAAIAYMGVTLFGLLALTPYWRWLGLL